ncbi:MAG: radical SAM protein [Anaerolineaceae bacterium]|nr:radical SAM protein [Anaerolineaceae bacterium]
MSSNPIAAFLTRRNNGKLNIISPGLSHYAFAEEGSKVRVHLRVDPDLSGLLSVNASRIYHLNPAAALIAFSILNKISKSTTVDNLKLQFKVDSKTALADFERFSETIQRVIHEDNSCPVCDLETDITQPFSANLSAPYRMDLALTYRCNNDCSHCYNARPRNYPERNTSDWKQILDKIWDVGIPHVVFTGGEPTLRPDLPELIKYAETKGLLTGINTNGRKLKDPAFLASLVDAGLDHVQITFESSNPDIHDQMVNSKGAWADTIKGIENVLESSLYMMTNTTLLQTNKADIKNTLILLARIGVKTVGINALIYSGKGETVGTGLEESEVIPILEIAKTITSENRQKLIWYTPTQYCHLDPVHLGFGVKGCSAALYNMCVEPDGEVIPCQSYYESVGNMLTGSWQKIWNHPLSTALRNRHFVHEECKICDLLPECGGGCPLAKDQFSPSAVRPTNWC